MATSEDAALWVSQGDKALSLLGERNKEKTPTITHKEFVEKVLPILERPYDKNNRERYAALVQHANFPVQVIDENGEVVHVIPPIYSGTDFLKRNKSYGNTLSIIRRRIQNQPGLKKQFNKDLLDRVTEDSTSFILNVVEPLTKLLAIYGKTVTIPSPEGEVTFRIKGDANTEESSKEDNAVEDDYDGLDYID